MKFEEHWYNYKERKLCNKSCCSDKCKYLKLSTLIDYTKNLLEKQYKLDYDAESKGDYDVEEKEHKEFAIGKSDTVWYPRAMMIHVKDTTLASRTVMAS